jgi:hypothetical protein
MTHASDCAVHNSPAMPNGPCDCGADFAERVLGPLPEEPSQDVYAGFTGNLPDLSDPA